MVGGGGVILHALGRIQVDWIIGIGFRDRQESAGFFPQRCAVARVPCALFLWNFNYSP
jgi:hypothetical protein